MYANAKSMYRRDESEWAVDLIVALVNFEPKSNGISPPPPKITLNDIGFFKAYKGQLRSRSQAQDTR